MSQYDDSKADAVTHFVSNAPSDCFVTRMVLPSYSGLVAPYSYGYLSLFCSHHCCQTFTSLPAGGLSTICVSVFVAASEGRS